MSDLAWAVPVLVAAVGLIGTWLKISADKRASRQSAQIEIQRVALEQMDKANLAFTAALEAQNATITQQNTRIDRLDAWARSKEETIDSLEGEITALKTALRAEQDYTTVLVAHINDGRPPPPPDRPKRN